jgi:hypothetical protein
MRGGEATRDPRPHCKWPRGSSLPFARNQISQTPAKTALPPSPQSASCPSLPNAFGSMGISCAPENTKKYLTTTSKYLY